MFTTGAIVAMAIGGGLLGCIIVLVVYTRLTCGKCECSTKLTGKTVIVTGATSGIGKETARDLAKRGARLILACRNVEAAKEVKDELIKETGNQDIVVKKLDVSSMKSVRQFAADINMNERRLHVLIHNAGVLWFSLKRPPPIEGLDATMATNYFGPFLLTNLLLDLLKRSAPARIVTVSSDLHIFSSWKVDEAHLNPTGFLPPFFGYCYSKFAVILFTRELSKRLDGTDVTANCLHPGIIETPIFRYAWFPLNIVFWLNARIYFKTQVEGAQTTIHCAVSEQLENVSGQYFADCKVQQISSQLLDSTKAKKMWELTESILKEPNEIKISTINT